MEKTNLVIPANSSPNSDNLELISIIPWDKSDSSQGQITIYRDLTKSVPTFLVGSSERIVEEERNKTIVIEAVKIGVSEGKKSYANLDITQEAATYDYVLELYSDVEDNTIPSSGGSCNITAALVIYRNGRKVSTVKVNPQLSGSSTGFKLVGNVVTAENRNMVIGPDRYIVISGYTDETVTGDTVVGTIMIKQQRNIIERVDFNDTLLYDKDIPASGGSINPIITVDRTYTYTTGNTINNSIPDSEYIESKSETIEFTTTREPIDPFTLDENTGTVSAPSRGTVKGPRLELPVSMNYSLDIKYTFDENHISFEDSVSDSAYQAENGMVYSDIEAYGSTEEVPASGGTVSEALKVIYKQIASFSSGEIEEIISGAEITYEPVEISSKGTEISNLDKRGVLPTTISLNGKSVTIDIDIYQKGNYVESIKGSVGTFSYPTIGAGDTSATPDLSAGFGILFTFTSGSTSSSKPADTYGSLEVISSFELSEIKNGFIDVNQSKGVLTATNRGTTIGDAWTSGTVNRTLVATWTPTTQYNIIGKKTDTWSTTATCTQEANIIESEVIEIDSFVYSKTIPYTGGTSTPSISVDSIKTYSSEAISRGDVTNYTKIFSSSNLPDEFSLNTSTGVVTGENYTGSTEHSASIKVDVSYTNTLGSVVTASKTATVVQEEADIVYSNPVITFTYPEAPASGGTLTPTLSVTQTWGYGQTTGGGSNTYNINTLPGGSYTITGTGITPTDKGVITIPSLGTTIKPRTKVGSASISVTLNGKTSSTSTDVYQAANEVTRVAIVAAGGNDNNPFNTSFPASGSTYIASGFWYFTSGAKKEATSVSIDNWSINGTGFSIIANSQYPYTVDVTAQNRGTEAGGARTATLSFTFHGKSTSLTLIQAENKVVSTRTEGGEYVYGNVTAGKITNATIPASGGSATATAGNGSQTINRNTLYTYNTYSSGAVGESSQSFNPSTITVNPSVASIIGTASSKGSTISAQNTIKSQAVTWTGQGGKSASGTMYVYQALNKVTTAVLVNSTAGSDTTIYPSGNFTAAGGTKTPTLNARLKLTFSSGTIEYSSGSSGPQYGGTFSISRVWSMVTATGFSLNTSNGAVTASNRGSTIGAARSCNPKCVISGSFTNPSSVGGDKVSASNVTDSFTLTQDLNKVTTLNITSSTGTSYPSGDIPASGGTKTPVGNCIWNYSYSSGATQGIELSGTSISRTYSMPATTGFSLNTSNGVVTGADRTTVTGSRRSATITCKATISYTNPSTVGGGTVSNSITDTLTVYQQANDVSYSDISVPNFSYPSADIPYQGGSKSPTLSYSQTASYTSGHTKTITTGASLTYAVTGTGFSINSSTGVVTASANTGARRTATVSVTIHLNNKIRSDTTRVYQAAWVKPTITLTMSYVSVSGAFTVQASSNVPESIEIMVTAYNDYGEGGDSTVTMIKGSNQANGFLLSNMPQYGIVTVDFNYSPYETPSVKYVW